MVIIVIDSREQKPYKFPKYETVVKPLKYGDYSILGHEDNFAIERKSFSDWVFSITVRRDPFKRLLENVTDMNYFALLIETDMRKIWKQYVHSKIHRKAIVNTALLWSIKYNIPVFFGSNRTQSKYIVKTLCEGYVKYYDV